MLKLPKGLKKKKKGKKSKHKEDELFTEEELEKYKKEHQLKQSETEEGQSKANEEWSKFKDLTTGIDSVLKKTQGDLDRIKSTSFFQKVSVSVKEEVQSPKAEKHCQVVEITEADLCLPSSAGAAAADEISEYGLTEDESEQDDQDDIFDTSYVEAVERGEVKLAYVPDSPEECADDDIFDTSHIDALIKGQEVKKDLDKKSLDIGVAVEVLTGRIDNVTITNKKRSKRVVPRDLLLENNEDDVIPSAHKVIDEHVEKSILDVDEDIPINTPIDLSVSLHTSFIKASQENLAKDITFKEDESPKSENELDEFALLAAESLSSEVKKIEEHEIKLEPVIKESWSAFEADKNTSVFAECIVEDQFDVLDVYADQEDPFDTSFAEAVIPCSTIKGTIEASVLEEDDDFDPRAEEVNAQLNNRRRSSVRIHLITPSGLRESITSDDIAGDDSTNLSRDLLGGSTTDLTQLGDSPLNPVDPNNTETDPFDTTLVEKIVAPGKVELKILEQELIGQNNSSVYRVDSDPDFDPRADEVQQNEPSRRPSRPENLTVSKSVIFDIDNSVSEEFENKSKPIKPLTPYYTREISITEDTEDLSEATDKVFSTLPRLHSDEELNKPLTHTPKRRHSEYSQDTKNKFTKVTKDLLDSTQYDLQAKVLTPTCPIKAQDSLAQEDDIDPFDTSFASNIAPSKTELRLLAKEFSCEEPEKILNPGEQPDLLDPSDDLFQVKALSPDVPDKLSKLPETDPFDTSFTGDLNPGKAELKVLESELLK